MKIKAIGMENFCESMDFHVKLMREKNPNFHDQELTGFVTFTKEIIKELKKNNEEVEKKELVNFLTAKINEFEHVIENENFQNGAREAKKSFLIFLETCK